MARRTVDVPSRVGPMAGQRIAVFFDIGDTLASPVVAGGRLTALDVYPLVPEVLDRLAAHRGRVALGLASNTGDETAASLRRLLDAAGLVDPFDDDLLLFSSVQRLDKCAPAFFTLATELHAPG